jgi:hypothetical protein
MRDVEPQAVKHYRIEGSVDDGGGPSSTVPLEVPSRVV